MLLAENVVLLDVLVVATSFIAAYRSQRPVVSTLIFPMAICIRWLSGAIHVVLGKRRHELVLLGGGHLIIGRFSQVQPRSRRQTDYHVTTSAICVITVCIRFWLKVFRPTI